ELVEQAGVLNSNNGLAGKALNQFDLLVGEWPHLLAIDSDHSDQIIVLEHGDAEQRACAGHIREFDGGWIAVEIALHCFDVSNLLHLLRSDARPSRRAARWGLPRPQRSAPPEPDPCIRCSGGGGCRMVKVPAATLAVTTISKKSSTRKLRISNSRMQTARVGVLTRPIPMTPFAP